MAITHQSGSRCEHNLLSWWPDLLLIFPPTHSYHNPSFELPLPGLHLSSSPLFSHQVPCEGAAYSSSAAATVTLKLSDIGAPSRADVRIEARGRQSSIRLDRVEVLNITNGGDALMFPYKDTVSTDSSSYLYRKVRAASCTATSGKLAVVPQGEGGVRKGKTQCSK